MITAQVATIEVYSHKKASAKLDWKWGELSQGEKKRLVVNLSFQKYQKMNWTMFVQTWTKMCLKITSRDIQCEGQP